MKTILAENMLRFGVKNLTESNEKNINYYKLLTEQAGGAAIRNMNSNEAAIVNKVKTYPNFDGWGTILSFLKSNGLYFLFSQEQAADWILLGYIRKAFGTRLLKKYANKDRKFERDATTALANLSDDIAANVAEGEYETEVVQLNQHPEEKDKILSIGKVTKNGVDSSTGRVSAASNLEEVCRWANTYNIVNNPFINPKEGKGMEFGPAVVNDNGALVVSETWQQSEESSDIWMWALKGVTPAESKTDASVVQSPPLVVVGDLAQSSIDNKYDVFMYELTDDAKTKIKQVLDAAKSIGEITQLNVIGQASTESVNLGTSNQASNLLAKWRGANQPRSKNIMLNQLPSDDKINGKGTVGVVTDPKASGNAAIAYQRAAELAVYVKSLGNTPTKTTAAIVAGAADARKVIVQIQVKKPDETRPVDPTTLVNTVGSSGTVTEFAPLFQCVLIDVDLY